MSYSRDDYLREEREANEKRFPKIKYQKETTANKQHFCDLCGCEIHPGEKLHWYKPRPTYNKRTKKKTYYKWKTRCIDHPPKSYEELTQIQAKEDKYGRY